jgi:hypothetical protein
MNKSPPSKKHKSLCSYQKLLYGNQVFGLASGEFPRIQSSEIVHTLKLNPMEREFKSRLNWLIAQIMRILKKIKFDDVLKITILPILKELIIQLFT